MLFISMNYGSVIVFYWSFLTQISIPDLLSFKLLLSKTLSFGVNHADNFD